MLSADNEMLQTFKELEDEASQLNRLGETGQAPFLLQDVFRRRQSSVLVVRRVQFLTRTENAIAFEQVRTES